MVGTIDNCTNYSIHKDTQIIGAYSFADKLQIETITIPEGVTFIGVAAFENCTNLKSVTISNSVIEIDIAAFSNCENLKTVIIGSGVLVIRSSAFDDCLNLKYVYYIGTKEEWSAISIDSYNDPFKNATIHYNYVPEN